MTTVTPPRKGEYAVPEGADIAECRSCGAAVVWTTTINRRPIPLSVASIQERDGMRWALAHFADCAHARDWSRRR
jgi:hypothetical protein